MRTQSLLIAAFAIACAGGAGLYLSGSHGAAAESTVPVVMAAADIPRGSLLTAEALALQRFPRGMAPEGALRTLDDAAGRSVLGHVARGELILEAKLAPRGTKGGIAALIPDGMRAIAIQIPNIATGVAGFILPGNKVDVLISYHDHAMTTAPRGAEILLENVEILAVDQRIEAPAENKVDANLMRSVTLLVSPDQAANLHDAMSKGTLHLSLRNPTDSSRGSRRDAATPFWKGLTEALAEARRAPRPAPAPARTAPTPQPDPSPVIAARTVRTVRSNRETTVTLTSRP